MAKIVLMKKVDGRLTFSEELPYTFSLLRNGTYAITITRTKEKRTVSQNALMWMWFTCIERQTGQPKQDVHDYYVSKFLQRTTNIYGKPYRVVGETKNLSTEQMSRFLWQVQADAETELGMKLPTPEDLYFEAFEQEFNY